jgi:hypothetical protein
MKVLKELRDAELTAVAFLAQCHRRRVIPLMERALRIYDTAEGADPDALARSRLLDEPFASVYAAQRAKRAMDTKKMVCEPNEVLWSPRMHPDDGHIELVRIFANLVCFRFMFNLVGSPLTIVATAAGDAKERLWLGSSHA